ncbi:MULTISPECIES: hypothetical protein [unclassified Mesorhizobium]|uniref:hypothetical protein n=1 Tax=unclassified Mesorhizobium TaxID=325217 RepID=UPI0019291AE6|nr:MULTISPECIES: hypothetical protein [unclassified Mesorhizobium]BCH22067.1 hypothetical protein MesoLjLb_18520 [Mesorhizobium sp. L-8-3]
MTDIKKMTKNWVEVREESSPGRIVLRPDSYNLPPARGRRHLDLSSRSQALAKSPGPADKLESVAGTWSVDGDELHLSAPGWEGHYSIEQLTEDLLVISKK